jgi:hypothetical protein
LHVYEEWGRPEKVALRESFFSTKQIRRDAFVLAGPLKISSTFSRGFEETQVLHRMLKAN